MFYVIEATQLGSLNQKYEFRTKDAAMAFVKLEKQRYPDKYYYGILSKANWHDKPYDQKVVFLKSMINPKLQGRVPY